MLSVSLVSLSRVTARSLHDNNLCLGVKRHLMSGHKISRLQRGLQLIMARYTRIINCIDHVVTYTYCTVCHLSRRVV